MPIIKVSNLTKEFSYYKKEEGVKNSLKNLFFREKLNKEAVKNISFEIEEGEIVGFLGPNGAGKTTTLKILAGILYPTSGTININGFVPFERKTEFKKQFSIVMGQKSQLWWDLPANESLKLNKCIYEISDKDYKDTVGELVELLNVKDFLDIQVRRLSLGERMKMELIASLLHKPKILFLDEPTIGLDLISQKNIREFLNRYNKKAKTTIILTSHYTKDIEDLCKRSIVINSGQIVYDGNLNNINDLLAAKKHIKVQFYESMSASELKAFGVIKNFDGNEATIEIDKKEVKEICKVILEKLPISDLNIEDIPLEESIEKLYRRGV